MVRAITKNPPLQMPDGENWHLPTDTIDNNDDFEESATDRLSVMLQETTGDDRAELKVYKLSANNDAEYCKSYLPHEFEAGGYDMLRNDFGAGKYRLVLYAISQPSNRFCIRNKTHITIADMKTANPQINNNQNGISQAIEMMAKNQVDMMQAIVSLKSAPPVDQMAQMGAMLGMMAQFKSVMGGENSQPKSQISEIVSAMRELRGAATELMPEKDEPKDDTMAMLGKVTNLIQMGMSAKAQENQMSVTAPNVQTPLTFQTEPQQTKQDENIDMNVITIIKLKSYMRQLVSMAETNQPVEDGAQLIYDKIPDEFIEVMELTEWFDTLTHFAPEITTHKEWLTKARDAALVKFDTEPTIT